MTFADVGKRLRALRDALVTGDMPTYRGVFARGVRRDTDDAFASGRDPVTGLPWAPLKWRVGQILVLTGYLRQKVREAADGPVPIAGGVKLTFPVDPFYGVFHQLGTRRVPQRRFFGSSPKTYDEARAAVVSDIAAVLKGDYP